MFRTINRSIVAYPCGNRFLYLLLLIVIFIILLIPARADDWPMARHDVRNTARSLETVKPPLKLLWKAKLGGVESGIPLISGNMICVPVRPKNGLGQETVVFNRSGRIVKRITNAIPIYLHDDTLIVAQLNVDAAAITRLDVRTGRARWTQRLDDPAKPLPQGIAPVAYFHGGIVQGDTIYCTYALNKPGHMFEALLALHLSDGTVSAKREVEHAWTEGTPAADQQSVYSGGGTASAGEGSSSFDVLDARTLQTQWLLLGGGNCFPMIVGGIAVTQGWAHTTQSIDLTQRKVIWSTRAWRGLLHCLVQDSSGRNITVEAKPSPKAVVGIDVGSGQILWQHPLIGSGMAASTGHYVFVPGWHEHLPGQKGLRGGLYCLDADTGHLEWKHEIPNARGQAVAVSDGRVYAIIGKELYAFGT